MSNKERSKQDARSEKRSDDPRLHDKNRQDHRQNDNLSSRSGQNDDQYRSTDLRDSPTMSRLMDAMENGEDVGQYGRLTFVMVARHFLSDDEILKLLEKQPEMDEKEARAMLVQVKERGYNPPKRERLLQWQERQDFQICPDPEDPNGCNLYRELQFPDEIYENIEDFWEEKAEAEDE